MNRDLVQTYNPRLRTAGHPPAGHKQVISPEGRGASKANGIQEVQDRIDNQREQDLGY